MPDDEQPRPSRVAAPRRIRVDAPRAVLALGVALFATLLFTHADFVPIWDGRIYADCVVDAVTKGFRVEALRCADHTSHAYVLLLALPQLASPGSFVLMLAVNAVLGALAVAAFYRLLRKLFPTAEHTLEVALVALAFAVHPVVVAAALQPNVDYGVLAFFVPCLVALLERRYVATCVFGALMIFSKETGAVVYVGLLGCYALWFVTRREGTAGAKWSQLRALVPALIPLVLLGLYLAARSLAPTQRLLWSNTERGHLLDDMTSFRLTDPVFLAAAAGIFLVNFLWIPSAFVAGDLARRAYRWAFRLPSTPVPGAEPDALGFVLAVTAVTALLLTRYRTFTNLRYFLPVYPLMLVAFYAAVARLPVRRALRVGLLATVAALLLVSNLRTVDPVSRAAYGTFAVGEHQLLDATSIANECCGRGRDQLVYNLEFVTYHYLQNRVFADVRPTAETVFAVDPAADWFLLGQLSPDTFARTLRTRDVLRPRYVIPATLVESATPPAEVYFLAFSNVGQRASLAQLGRRYDPVAVKTYTHHGYALTVYRLRLR